MSKGAKFFRPSTRLHLAGGPESVQGFQVYLIDCFQSAICQELPKISKRGRAASARSPGGVLVCQVICGDSGYNFACVPQTATKRHQFGTARLRALSETVRRVFDLRELPSGACPITRAHALADADAVNFAIAPDRALALDPSPPFRPVGAFQFMAWPKTQHGYRVRYS